MEIKDYRDKIDNIDKNIGALLNERLNVCREIGKLKKDRNIPVTDEEREKTVIGRVCESGDCSENREAIGNIYQAIFDETKKIQQKEN